MNSIYDDILNLDKTLKSQGVYNKLGKGGKLAGDASQLIGASEIIPDYMDDVNEALEGGDGGTESIIPTAKPITRMVERTFGSYGLESGTDSATRIKGDILAGGTSENVTDIVERVNSDGLYGYHKGGLFGKDGRLASLGDNSIVKGGKNLVENVGKKVADEVATNPNLAPTKEFVKGVKQGAKPVAEVAAPVVEKAKNLVKPITAKTGEILTSKGAKLVGGVASVAGGALTAAQGIEEMVEGDSPGEQAGGGMQAAGGVGTAAAGGAAIVSALSGNAAANFWNPVGWVSAALAVGGTLVTMFTGKKGGRKKGFNFRGKRDDNSFA